MPVPTSNVSRSGDPLRKLTASDLGIESPVIAEHGSSRADDTPLTADDPHLLAVRRLMDRFGGVIFTGPPGTSKSYSAGRIGTALTDGDKSRLRFTQFHPSYQYEDFMQGFVPKDDGSGFELADKHFVAMCVDAGNDPDHLYVLVIDELSRGDPGRVFGEALTYIERSKRGLEFELASGDSLVVPENVFILATMNPLDRGVDEVDAAFERRFAKIPMEPDRSILGEILEANGIDEMLRRRIIGFFDMVNGRARTNPNAAVGHTYFSDVVDEQTLRDVWDYQLRFIIEKAYRLDTETRDQIHAGWLRVIEEAAEEEEAGGGDPSDDPAAIDGGSA